MDLSNTSVVRLTPHINLMSYQNNWKESFRDDCQENSLRSVLQDYEYNGYKNLLSFVRSEFCIDNNVDKCTYTK